MNVDILILGPQKQVSRIRISNYIPQNTAKVLIDTSKFTDQ